MKSGILQAIEKFDNSQSELARKVGVTPQCVQRWARQGFTSRKAAKLVAKVSGVSVKLLRPDLYGPL